MPYVDFKEELHPRAGKGSHTGGQFVSKGGGTEVTRKERRYREYKQPSKEVYSEVHDGLKGLTDDEAAVVSNYVQNADKINQRLRHGVTFSGALDDLMQRASLSQDVVVYQGADEKFAKVLEGLKPGDRLRDVGYMSTTLMSLGPKQAMRIYAEAGDHAVVAGAHDTAGTEFDEIIFARDSTLVYQGKGEDGTPEFDLEQDVKADGALSAAVVDVGGDVWNRETAVRLEREYVAAKPALEALAVTAVGKDAGAVGDDENYQPEEWDAMSSDQQEQALTDYKEKTYQEYYDSEVQNWNSESAPDEALYKTAQDFMDGTEADWAGDALETYLKEDYEGPRIPYTVEQLHNALVIEHDTGHWPKEKGTKIGWDNSQLQEPDTLVKEQILLPGVEPIDPASALTTGMREELEGVIKTAFEKRAEEVLWKLEPPDYIGESIAEFQNENWDSMSDFDKFEWVKKNTEIIEDRPEPETLDALPGQFDPLQEGKGLDYHRTQKLARYMSRERAVQLIKDRVLGPISSLGLGTEVSEMDHYLWDNWKGSSTSTPAMMLQNAIADELGGRYRQPKKFLGVSREDVIKQADRQYRTLGGYEGVKAYVRAKWETTQYLLDKANKPVLELYRGIAMPEVAVEETPKVEVEILSPEEAAKSNKASNLTGGKWVAISSGYAHGGTQVTEFATEEAALESKKLMEKWQAQEAEKVPKIEEVKAENPDVPSYKLLPEIKVERNGAQSTSLNREISNGWGNHSTRVVLRALVPRTAAVSVPAYGVNIHSEREVVIAGVGWIGWDAWKGRAPSFKEVPLQ